MKNKAYFTRLINWLVGFGYTLTATSKNHSYYLHKDLFSIRISDHIKNKDCAYTFQIIISPINNLYVCFFNGDLVTAFNFQDLKAFIVSSETILNLNAQKAEREHISLEKVCAEYRKTNEVLRKEIAAANLEINTLKQKLNQAENKANQSPKAGTITALKKAQQTIQNQRAELTRLNTLLKK